MSVKKSNSYIIVLFVVSMLFACGESDSGTETMSKSASSAPAAAPAMDKNTGDSMEKGNMEKGSMEKSSMGMDNGVIYQDEIYKNWPYQ